MEPNFGGAEAVLNMQPDSSISIAYDPHFGPHDDLMLLELDEKLLPDLLREKVTLRGQPEEEAVLCTESKTYGIKFVGTSNSVFLIPPCNNQNQAVSYADDIGLGHQKTVSSVIKVATGGMELNQISPKLEKLKSLLLENPCSFDVVEEMKDIEINNSTQKGLYKWDDFVHRVQASDNELRTGLAALSAVEINGYWRIVDEDYMDNILTTLVENSILKDWSLDSLDEDEVVNQLIDDRFPRVLALHCLSVFCRKVDKVRCSWRLDDGRVCVHFARRILGKKKMKKEDFMRELMMKVPDKVEARFDMLEGEVLTEMIGIETWVYAFRLSWLPSTPEERFSALFKERRKWEWNDLQPYIRDLKVPGLSSEALLIKYTRRTQPNIDAQPVFSAR